MICTLDFLLHIHIYACGPIAARKFRVYKLICGPGISETPCFVVPKCGSHSRNFGEPAWFFLGGVSLRKWYFRDRVHAPCGPLVTKHCNKDDFWEGFVFGDCTSSSCVLARQGLSPPQRQADLDPSGIGGVHARNFAEFRASLALGCSRQIFVTFDLLLPPNLERKRKGGFAKGRFWRMCPRSGLGVQENQNS